MTSARGDAQKRRQAMNNANALKLGLFGANLSSARTATTVVDRWTGSWADCVEMARIADEGGIDFLLPVGRWKGYGGETDFHGSTLETITWAAGILAATKRITVFGTVHAPMFHPLIAAKQMVTADQIGEGRFGLNIVAGWNEGEFEMFGLAQREHDERYTYAEEWLSVIQRAWSAEEKPFNVDGRWLKLRGVSAKPKPFGGTRPLIMNAGSSGAGQSFALRNCDAFFTSMTNARISGVTDESTIAQSILEGTAAKVAEVKAEATSYGREIEVYTQGQVICRPTQREAEEYYHWANLENAEWPAIERMLELRGVTRENTPADAYAAKRRMMALTGIGGHAYVGTPDKVASDLALLSKAGLRGIAFSFVNYVKDAPFFCAEVLPRLARMGLRAN